MNRVKILTISGSLSKGSSNAQVLQYISQFFDQDIQFILSDSIRELPHFNPELDTDPVPVAVEKFRQQLKNADAILIYIWQ